MNSFGKMQTAIEARGLTPLSADTEFVPQTPITSLTEAQGIEVLTLVDKLEQDEDVQQVFHNLG